jgi:hypothetical protein
MKIHFFIEDTHLPPKNSKCISSHLITCTASEKPREQNLRIIKVMILVVRLGQLTDIIVKTMSPLGYPWGGRCKRTSVTLEILDRIACNKKPTDVCISSTVRNY